jgi:hypothetical protein
MTYSYKEGNVPKLLVRDICISECSEVLLQFIK